jgi:cytochrome c1
MTAGQLQPYASSIHLPRGGNAMRGILKWIGIVLGGLVVLIAIAGVSIYFASEARLNATFDVPEESMSFYNNDEAVALGEHLAVIRGCTDCHSEDLGGKVMIADPMLGMVYASNLTAGAGGIGESYSDESLARAIRHGVGADDNGLLVMPSEEFFIFSDEDVNALVAYIRSLPAVDREPEETKLSLLGRALFMAGQLPPLSAEVIDHNATRPAAPQVAADADYGEYLAITCTGCHGKDFAGAPIPGAPPDTPPSANLTPGGSLANWDEAGFIQALRTGVTPDGKTLDPAQMPWPATAVMSDLELQALWRYLQSLPAVQ